MQSRLSTFLAALFLFPAVVHAEEPAWIGTLERISSGVVSIRVDSTRAFDTEWNSSSQATGFVVDAERGLILTNRHVVTPGPVVAEAVFLNNEEVRLTPIYRDPVHDFGFFRYDPADLKYIKPAELPLTPGAASIGREIRVIGNDAGEQLSILAGTIARLDRRAPEYGRGKYNDFNTFYFQAASGTSGGSSGSPVVNIDGEVVALNAGGANSAASSFFLPLDRIARALRLIQDDQLITRGTLQTEFVRQTYDELTRLGLTAETEALTRERFPDQTGMLVIHQVVPDSPADGKLQPGDILVRANDKLITSFVPLAALLDATVGATVTLELERGGRRLVAELEVTNLHRISPDEFLEFGDAIVNNLSYQQARHYNRSIEGVYVASPGYMLARAAVPRGAVISEVGGVATRTIDDLERALGDLADGDRTTLRFFTIEDPRNSIVRSVEMDRVWFPAKRCARDDETGLWPCRPLADGPPKSSPEGGSTRFSKDDDSRVDAIVPSLVMVNFDLPYTISGVADRHYYGTGLIVDTSRGLVLVDRNTVPVAMGDVTITFAGSLEVSGKVEFIHPLHNIAVVSYDPALIGDTPVRAARFDKRPLQPGAKVWVVGLKGDHQVAHQESTVASVDPLVLPLSRTLRFRDSNLEAISLVTGPGDFDGVITNNRGEVLAKWSSFAYQSGGESGQFNGGISSDLLIEIVDVVRSDKPIYSLETELGYAPLFAARKLGLDEDWLRKLERHDPKGRRALSVQRIVAGSPAANVLRNGDMILAIDDQLVTSFRQLERAVQKPQVTATVWRDGTALQLDISTVPLDGMGIDRVLSWAGALLQDPHRAMAAQRGIDTEGVYVAFFSYGSPATRYGLWAGRRVVAVDDTETPDLQSFTETVAQKRAQTSLRLKTVTWNGAVEVITLKPDNHYWPAYEIRRTPDGWQRRDIG
ncbi:MAG: PDZ domain-containing protein [Woeseia sp.]|nr:PDZ domain-containing protein [Woeseia sp.]NNE61831.1 PDZ domain-containing protein [Woeseia sp.]NNL54614.1 PDZ domain-containing protein [Woeseia sp.]